MFSQLSLFSPPPPPKKSYVHSDTGVYILSWCSSLFGACMFYLHGTPLLTGLGMDLTRIQMVSDVDPFFLRLPLQASKLSGTCPASVSSSGGLPCQKFHFTGFLEALSWIHVESVASFCTSILSLYRFGITSASASLFSPNNTIRSPSLADNLFCFWSFIWGRYP